MPRVILASQSPRRRELLRRLGVTFTVCPSHVPERNLRGESPARYAIRLALAKAHSVSRRYPDRVVIGADTVVVYRNIIFGKPRSPEHAFRMLSTLSGTRHEVLSAVAVVQARSHRRFVDLDRAVVTTRRLPADRLRRLAHKHQDKAGAYAVQERSDEVVKHVRGSYYTVVGLPVHQVHHLLALLGIPSNDLPEPDDIVSAAGNAGR